MAILDNSDYIEIAEKNFKSMANIPQDIHFSGEASIGEFSSHEHFEELLRKLIIRYHQSAQKEAPDEFSSRIRTDPAGLLYYVEYSKFLYENEMIAVAPSVIDDLIEPHSINPEWEGNSLIYGERGTGKELMAKFIHSCSKRSEKPFKAVNCASIPDTLFESELFGYKKGSHSTAYKNRAGLLKSANGGTLFLDEVSKLSFYSQGKLLRFLQEGVFLPLGADKEEKADVLIIAASNVDLWDLVDRDMFLPDLFDRLAQITYHVPPLENRSVHDIQGLVHFFFSRALHKRGYKRTAIPVDLYKILLTVPYSGNIRELKARCEDIAFSQLITDRTTKEFSLKDMKWLDSVVITRSLIQAAIDFQSQNAQTDESDDGSKSGAKSSYFEMLPKEYSDEFMRNFNSILMDYIYGDIEGDETIALKSMLTEAFRKLIPDLKPDEYEEFDEEILKEMDEILGVFKGIKDLFNTFWKFTCIKYFLKRLSPATKKRILHIQGDYKIPADFWPDQIRILIGILCPEISEECETIASDYLQLLKDRGILDKSEVKESAIKETRYSILDLAQNEDFKHARKAAMQRFEKAWVQSALDSNIGLSDNQIAKKCGISPSRLCGMKKLLI